jgi:predicted phosphodiesterase
MKWPMAGLTSGAFPMKIYVPSRVFAPVSIKAPVAGCVFLSDSHDKRGWCQAGKKLAKYFRFLSIHVVVCLGGDVFQDTHQVHLFGANTPWLEDEKEWITELALFIQRGGKVYFIPGNHNAEISAFLAKLKQNQLPVELWHILGWGSSGNELPPLEEYLLEALGQIKVVPSLMVEHRGKKYLLDHGHRFDWFLPNVVGRLERWKAKFGLLNQPKPEAYGSRKNYGRGKFLVNVLGQAQAYARWAKSLGTDEVFIGHWHCAGEVWHSQGIPVRVASCLTNGQDVLTRVTPDGQVITFRLQDQQ